MPRDKKIGRVAFRASKSLMKAIEEEAEKYNTTMSDVMVRILSEKLLSQSIPCREDPLDAIDRLMASL